MSGQSTGIVELGGEIIRTTYAQTGLNRTWYWNLDSEGRYKHSVSLRGDGVALYFDFSSREGSAGDDLSPEFFACREFSLKNKQEIDRLFK